MTESKKRHGCLAAYLIFMMVICTTGAGVYLLAGNFVARGNPEIPAALRPVFAVINLLAAVCAVALWRWKKWGFWGFVIMGVLGGILNTYLTRSLITALMVPLSILIMYGILHIGGERKGWRQLE
ncbi:MAG: hypothetical protein A3K19_27610 [Lentisphaerae bacterium RIFOXYB12_FULL_65_16]|nr:MAG: hypothetical protein A3K18_24980 [Lentisphaerae bacterium RIFOXYA12_64_32]OGV86071.1 MAG: hypothetical protein A3K19_27610 [Lentisphaerae bacterium RIFOXYB12_FULL_65_16]